MGTKRTTDQSTTTALCHVFNRIRYSFFQEYFSTYLWYFCVWNKNITNSNNSNSYNRSSNSKQIIISIISISIIININININVTYTYTRNFTINMARQNRGSSDTFDMYGPTSLPSIYMYPSTHLVTLYSYTLIDPPRYPLLTCTHRPTSLPSIHIPSSGYSVIIYLDRLQ